MKIFKDYTFNWRQIGIFKISLISFGILIGAYWHDLFLNGNVMAVLAIVFAVSTAYTVYVSIKQTS
jgi:hypothetical protein